MPGRFLPGERRLPGELRVVPRLWEEGAFAGGGEAGHHRGGRHAAGVLQTWVHW